MIYNIRKESITLFTDNKSVAELTLMDNDLVPDLFIMPENMLLYMFNRINVLPRNQGQGDGTTLLTEICRIADENQFAIFLGINAYGRMDTEELRQWYTKYGWYTIVENMMVRFPKK